MLRQIMEIQPEHETDSGRQLSRVDDIIPPSDDEFRAVNFIIHSLGQHEHSEGSLHRALNSPTRSESNDESWDPIREIYVIEGEAAPTEEDFKQQEDKEAHWLQQVAMAAADA